MASWWKLVAIQAGIRGTAGSWPRRVAQELGYTGNHRLWSEEVAVGVGLRGPGGSWERRLVGRHGTTAGNPLRAIVSDPTLLESSFIGTEAGQYLLTENGHNIIMET